MSPDIYWIDHPYTTKLAIMAHPPGRGQLENEIDHWKTAGIHLVVSLLMPHEVAELGLEEESDLCESRGIDFVSFPVPDRGIPGDLEDTRSLAKLLNSGGKTVAIHCWAGIGRSSLIAAAALVVNGMRADAAFALIQSARGVAVPETDLQRSWLVDFQERVNGA